MVSMKTVVCGSAGIETLQGTLPSPFFNFHALLNLFPTCVELYGFS